MSIDPSLKTAFEALLSRHRQVSLWCRLAVGWAVCALLGLGLVLVQRTAGWGSSLALPFVLLIAVAVFLWLWKTRPPAPDWRRLAAIVENHFPELDGRLITAVQQPARPGSDLNYFQARLIEETMAHRQHNDWSRALPAAHLNLAHVLHWSALLLFLLVLPGLRITGGAHLLARITDSQLNVTPGDTTLERGSSLVVLARFTGQLPPAVELALGDPGSNAQVISLVKSLADPVFGGSVPEVQSNLVYRIQYGGRTSRDFKVTVFEFPRLEHADIDVKFPDYTGQPAKHIANTRRLSAVEGSRVDLALRLNKPVASAQLTPRGHSGAAIPLQVDGQQPSAALKEFPLVASQNYDLQLIDAEGRTNKTPAQFIFVALTNRTPEFQLTSPRGDQRPSPLEEIGFEGTVWDDFGLMAYGLGYAIPGQETRFIELGTNVPGREKKPFKHVLRLEELELKPDQLISWFVWGDDMDSNGHVRRTTSDLFFGEIRPFEEVFREGMAPDGQSGMSGQQQNSPASRLTELQKQIINATWRLRREHPVPASPQSQAQPPRAPNQIKYAVQRGIHAAPVTADPGLNPRSGLLMAAFAVPVFARADAGDPPAPLPRPKRAPAPKTSAVPSYSQDATVVHDSQAEAIQQAEAAARRVDDARQEALWSAAIAEMEKARARLQAATNSPAALAEALAAEQAAYQALLKVQQHEYMVTRNQNRNQNGGGGGRDQQMQRQLEQMDLTQSENRYETQRQAQRAQNNERREDLQVMSRLQELARRQQDLNDRLKELQAALEEAKTQAEREEIQRRLKRLQEEEQQMLADVDELRQRMDRPENQSRMAEERQQLENTREDVQKASEAAARNSPSQALASGTRAQRQLQEMRDNMRKKNSSQFADDLRQMRSDARDLARQQEQISSQMQAQLKAERSRLSDSAEPAEIARELQAQKERLTNLVQRATEISQQAEEPEPVLSRQLYDTVRKYTQDAARNLQEAQDELLNHRLLTRDLYERLKRSSDQDGAKLLDLTSELWRQEIRKEDFQREAAGTAQRARSGIDDFKSGVERAADSVLGDDTEALRMAQEQLKDLTDQLQREMADAEGTDSTNQIAGARGAGSRAGENVAPGRTNSEASASNQAGNKPGDQASGKNRPGEAQQGSAGEKGETPGQNSAQTGQSPGRQPGQTGGEPSGEQAGNQPGNQAGEQPGQQPGEGSQPGQGEQPGQGQQPGQVGQPGEGQGRSQSGRSNARSGSPQDGSRRGGRPDGASGPGGQQYGGGGGGWDWNRFWNDPAQARSAPLTGENFGPWSENLRDVEEMIDDPALRSRVAVARERARLVRQEFKRDRKKPDWAVVRLQVVNPLAEVRDRIADELARRQSNDALVPIDRDPVPSRYSDLVRRYYEELGKGAKP